MGNPMYLARLISSDEKRVHNRLAETLVPTKIKERELQLRRGTKKVDLEEKKGGGDGIPPVHARCVARDFYSPP